MNKKLMFCLSALPSALAVANATWVCPTGFEAQMANGAGGRLCASATEGIGPFPAAMIDVCRKAVGGAATSCNNEKWSLSLVKRAYGLGVCPAGTNPLSLPGAPCSDGAYVYGPFSNTIVDQCNGAKGTGCGSNRWPLSLLYSALNAPAESLAVTEEQALEMFQKMPFYKVALTSHDLDWSKTPLAGVHTPGAGGIDLRSEKIYPPFVLAPRRQTDAMVRQLYALLPKTITDTTAFVVADRFAQNPEAYLPYLKSRPHLVIAGSFKGIDKIATPQEYTGSLADTEHRRELAQLEGLLALSRALGIKVVNVTFAMGDSSGAMGLPVRNDMERKMNALLVNYGLAQLHSTLTWGADETIAMAMAKLLPPLRVRLHFANPDARQWYDSLNTAAQITREKLPLLGLSEVAAAPFDFEFAVFTRRPGGAINDYQSGDTTQTTLDTTFRNRFANYTAAQRQRLAIVDGRLFNGAWDNRSLITPNTDYLSFGAWGTFGNKLGLTAAVAKIVLNNPLARRQMFLEAVAHDVFLGGYAEAQRGALYANVRRALGTATVSNFYGWTREDQTSSAFWEANTFVNQRMKAFYGTQLGSKTFRFTPQFWRFFEADVRMTPADVALPVGVFRTLPDYMDPRQQVFPVLDLPALTPSAP